MNVVRILNEGGVGVVPTDTLYGVVARADNEKAVRRVYAIKGRTPTKPCIILLAEIKQLEHFGIIVDEPLIHKLSAYWPGPVSVILTCGPEAPAYLHRGTQTLAFRLPNEPALRTLIRDTGPLIAPSANPEGQSPATTMHDAYTYFGQAVDFYNDGGTRLGPASRIIDLTTDDVRVVRAS